MQTNKKGHWIPNSCFCPGWKLNTLTASLNPNGLQIKLAKKYATGHLIGHNATHNQRGIPVGTAKIKAITRLIIKLIKNATGFQIFILDFYIFPGY